MSVAVGAVKLVTEHSEVMFAKLTIVATGAVLSSIITLCVCVDVFPFPSLYVQVTVVVPWVMIGKVALCVPVIVPAQLSVAVGAVNVDTEHSDVTFNKFMTFAIGAVLSPIVRFNVTILSHPFAAPSVIVCTAVVLEL